MTFPPSAAHASTTQACGPPTQLLSAMLDHTETLVGVDAKMRGTALTVGHQ